MSKIPLPSCFTPFTHNVCDVLLPKQFTYPFCYKPHKLAELACNELQQKLTHFHPLNLKQKGRMYGVLIVKSPTGELGYLSALSGNANDCKNEINVDINFVPAIHQTTDKTAQDIAKQSQINAINSEIAQLASSPKLVELTQLFTRQNAQANEQVYQLQSTLRNNKKQRKEKRLWLASANLPEDEYRNISIDLSRQSVTDKKRLIALKTEWDQRLAATEQQLSKLTSEIELLKKARKKLSSKLQKEYFKQYQLLNIQGVQKDLLELFRDTIQQKPPAGAGDCAAPKLLQYAFSHHLTPVCMAEFWWGEQPKSEIRKHLHFYPACQGKCQPILTHMLNGMDVEENPLLKNPAEGKELEIIYSDEHLVVVNKPADFLSVPGKTIQDSVYTRIKDLFPQATGSLILHRLDMATSGLLILALNERAHKHLQHQFIDKKINKRYVAIIDGLLTEESGKITLPLRGDFDDRPRQMVCFEHGKKAETHWQVIEQKHNQTKLFLYPISGRTHQLRVHCAHPQGLNMPIIGDGLYGTHSTRLHLHAQRLSFIHPITKQELTFEIEANF
ncbi:RluA family pseudouridine synthase [Colwellia sp. RSH04]|uniref:RluA family pseudouridine synthase n=1 Tax=Colwellia sp. RSH04 TaxID=2305464 RepID=UPI000E595B98|nr:RluA family pseudouridine synthase [Colwellia sp. RSH04]RHW77877.1 RluA family pseudouridine synthase [Colwellia sp. RSH04]